MTMNVQLEQAMELVKRLPPVVGRPQAEFDEIVALLAEPTALFGEPSTACDGSCCRPTEVVDWYQTAEDMDKVLRHHRLRWPQVIQMLQVAAQVLNENSLQLCDCPPRVTLSPKESGFAAIRYELRVDASWELACALTTDCSWRLIDMDLHEMGIRIAFRGRWDGPADEEFDSRAVVEMDDEEDQEYD